MTSVRHMEAPVLDAAVDGYLDSAREAILAVGWSRTTLTDIARRAGVSRMTLYRRWPDMRSLLADLMTREWSRSLSGVLAEPDTSRTDADPLADLVRDLCRGVRALRENELLARIIELDPERLLPYLLQRPGRSQEVVAGILAERIRQAQAAGAVRPGDPAVLSRALMLACHGFTLSAHTMGDPADFDAALADLAERFLTP